MAQLKIAVASSEIENIKIDPFVTAHVSARRAVLDGTVLADWLMNLPPDTLHHTLHALKEMRCLQLENLLTKSLPNKEAANDV